MSRRDGNDEIYVTNADGSDPTRLTANTSVYDAPAWSPDGHKIVFQSNRDGNTEIYTMKADGTDQTRLTDYPGRDQDADWSHDGRTIVFEQDEQPISDLTIQPGWEFLLGSPVRGGGSVPSAFMTYTWGEGTSGRSSLPQRLRIAIAQSDA